MKKIINLFALIACFTFLAASTSDAQNMVRNATNCAFEVHVSYGNTATCTSFGSVSVIVPANTMIALPIPFFFGIIESKGYYVGSSCVYYVGQPCSIYPSAVGVVCNQACGDYKAELLPFGIWLHN